MGGFVWVSRIDWVIVADKTRSRSLLSPLPLRDHPLFRTLNLRKFQLTQRDKVGSTQRPKFGNQRSRPRAIKCARPRQLVPNPKSRNNKPVLPSCTPTDLQLLLKDSP